MSEACYRYHLQTSSCNGIAFKNLKSFGMGGTPDSGVQSQINVIYSVLRGYSAWL